MAYPLSRNILGPILKRRLVKIEGLEHIPSSGPFLIVANHVGYQDPVLLATAFVLHTHRKFHAIAKWKILRIPILKRWVGIIPLHKDKQKTIELAVQHIERGNIVVVYPEGTVNFSQSIENTKTGAARIALRTGCPVIPVGIRRVSRPPRTQFQKYLEIAIGKMELYVGAPMYFSAQTEDRISHELIHETHDTIMRAIADLAKKHYTPKVVVS